jgi:hypothetical protein
MPLPEHPRPDLYRNNWINLNGDWNFRLDSLNKGIDQQWFNGKVPFAQKISVPFSWTSQLSGVADQSPIGWYKREISVPSDWQHNRVFLVVGAADWQTDVWLDGEHLGRHEGGYVPFEFELPSGTHFGDAHTLVVRVDDSPRPHTLQGKQAYGDVKGIWQTVYLEARGKEYVKNIRLIPDVDQSLVHAEVLLPEYTQAPQDLTIRIKTPNGYVEKDTIVPSGKLSFQLSISLPQPRLWSLDDPYLHETQIILNDDTLNTYFGMRKVSIVNLPDTEFPYVAINDQPVYLQMALDQAYHPEGYYTFPSDTFLRMEVQRAKEIGLNGIRPHIKVPIPRKLYWADKLGMLVMADLPNSPDPLNDRSRQELDYTLRAMIGRDFNHPSIFSWVVFNETWGLRQDVVRDGQQRKEYQRPEQLYAAGMYYITKSLDSTRLVDDNSIHSHWCALHTVTDLNSSHDYLMGHEWEQRLKARTEQSYAGSTFQYAEGFSQAHVPSINTECGNVWGYKGTTGDVDWSYDYHRMTNTFRKYPEMAGWLYTEHHDVVNEWNGYWRYDRSQKYTGLEELVQGMTLNDFHSPVYLSTGNEITHTVQAGATVQVPLYLSAMTDADHGSDVEIAYVLEHTNAIAQVQKQAQKTFKVPYHAYMQQSLPPLMVTMPQHAGLAILKLYVKNDKGEILHRNFVHFEVLSDAPLPGYTVLEQAPDAVSAQAWSLKETTVLNGAKMNGMGKGFFEYTFRIPQDYTAGFYKEVWFMAELSAKEFYKKDMSDEEKSARNIDFNARLYPDSNPNAYPMTDEKLFPSDIVVSANGVVLDETNLPDDPADHRGVLSWHHQVIPEPAQDQHELSNWHKTLMGSLQEAGSYGFFVKMPIDKKILKKAAENDGLLTIRLETKGKGGIAVYGQRFGRYPLNPSVVMKNRDKRP